MSNINLNKSDLGSYAMYGVLAVLFFVAFSPAWKELFHTWKDSEEYSHGFLIIPIFFYLIWEKREFIRKVDKKASFWGLILILFSLALFVFSNHANILTASSLSLVIFIVGLVIYLCGFSMFKIFIFPIAFLLFMIPIPSQIYSSMTLPLQLFVTAAAAWLGTLLGMPIYREGNVITLPSMTLQVVDACSGLRTMISLLTLSALYGYMTLKSNLLRMTLFLVGVPVAVIVNMVRVLLISLAIHYFQLNLTVGTPHVGLGILLFAFALFSLFFIQRLVSPLDKR